MADLTEEEAMARLREFVASKGTQKAAAETIGVSATYLCDVLSRQRDPSGVLARIGLRRVVMYAEGKP